MERDALSGHISQRYNADLEEIRNRVLTMGGMVEKHVADAIKAVTLGDSELGAEVSRSDYKINAMEVMIDEECNRILALRQPAASDLRVILMVIKTITDLERIGDEAERIGGLAVNLCHNGHTQYPELRHLGEHVRVVLREALDAFARMDVEAALRVAREDLKIDEEHEALMRQVSTFMMEDPRSIRRLLDVMWCARSMERIGDHAKNLCEYVVYMVLGKDVRHTTLEQMEEQVKTQGR